MSNNKYDKKGEHKYLRLIKEMMSFIKERNGYISVDGIKYGPKEDFGLTKFIAAASDHYTEEDNLYRFTGSKKPFKSSLSRFQTVEASHMDVIDSVAFRFGDDDRKMNKGFGVNKTEIYIDQSEPGYQCGARILSIYPDLAVDLNEQIAWTLKNEEWLWKCIWGIQTNYEFPFRFLWRKIINHIKSLGESQKSNLWDRMKKLGEAYEEIFNTHLINPRRRFGELIVGSGDFSVLDPNGNISLYNDVDKVFDNGYLLTKDRYDQIIVHKEFLLDVPIVEWPELMLEHIILAYTEYVMVFSTLIEIVKEEVDSYVGLQVFYHKFGDPSLTAEKRNLTIREFSKLLLDYRFTTDFESLFNFSAGYILTQEIKRVPDLDFKDKFMDWRVIDAYITTQLRIYLFERLAHHTRLSNPDVRDIEGELEYWPEA